ncbi:Hypothetical predicted protein [Paramuricea clavata]|uniref:Uncharacterized protein n=1 Tax=Paramuricea clavata TaxID=317549 RepID=A0A6S7GKZ5_PARCT|nr:Hypothetical predicted protein [Paramuricea clavata]
MAYARSDTSPLRNAILRLWTPAVGARSLDELRDRHINKVMTSPGNPLDAMRLLDNMPFTMHETIEIYSDNQPLFEIGEVIISGSWSEGLYFYGHSNTSIPDLDYMLVLKNISFSEEDQRSGYLTLKEDTPFIYAYMTDENTAEIWKDFLVDHEDTPSKRLSSKKLKERLKENKLQFLPFRYRGDNSNSVGEGAAIYSSRCDFGLTRFNEAFNYLIFQLGESSKIGNGVCRCKNLLNDFYKLFTGCDIVLAISCDGWPSCAREWITRHRNWPEDNLIQEITHDAVVKYHQNTWSPNIKEIITTYHLKTIAFWYFEKRTQDSFTEETVATHLILLLQELAEALRNRELPMYFMPKVNLFGNVENPEEAIEIAEKIEQLSLDFLLVIKGLENITSECTQLFCIFHNIKKWQLDHPYIGGDRAHPPPHDHKTISSKILMG